MGLLKAESYRTGMVKSTVLNVAAKGIGFFNSLLIIYLFGSGLGTDFYFLILATITLFSSFINGVDLLILVPEAMRLRIQEGEQAEKRFLNFFIFLYAGVGVLISIVIALAPVFFYSLFSKYGHATLNEQWSMLWLSAILFPISLLNSLIISILTSHRYFTVPMITNVVNSVISITVLFVLKDVISVKATVVAMMIAYVVNFVWLLVYMKRHLKWTFFEKLSRPSKTVISNILLMQLNILPVSVRSYLTIFLLSGLGSGIITAYNYGYQLSTIPHMLISTQVVAVAGVKFNELSSKKLHADLDSLVNQLLKLLYVILLPMAALMALCSGEITTILFSHSNKVSPDTIANISLVIFFMSLTLPSLALDLTLTRLLTAQQRIREGVLYAVITHVVIVALVYMGITLYGLKGFLLAFFFGYNVFLPFLYYLLLKKVTPFIQYLKWIVSSLLFICCNIVLVLLLWFVKQEFMEGINPWISIAAISAVYLAVILSINYFINYYTPVNRVINKYMFKR